MLDGLGSFPLGQPSPCPSPSAGYIAVLGTLGDPETEDHDPHLLNLKQIWDDLSPSAWFSHTLVCPPLPPLPSQPGTNLELAASWKVNVGMAIRDQRINPSKLIDG